MSAAQPAGQHAAHGNARLIEVLIAAGADVAAKNVFGYGPQCAAMRSLHTCRFSRMW